MTVSLFRPCPKSERLKIARCLVDSRAGDGARIRRQAPKHPTNHRSTISGKARGHGVRSIFNLSLLGQGPLFTNRYSILYNGICSVGFMTDETFIRATLRGRRFKDGEIHLSVIADMATFQEMVIDVAKWQFKEDLPSRERTPHDFAQIYLKLTGLEKGSTIANIGIGTTRSIPFGVPNQECFEKAADRISDAIGCAQQDTGQHIPIPKRFLSYFNRFGRSLGDGEQLVVKAVGHDPICLTPESRERLVLGQWRRD